MWIGAPTLCAFILLMSGCRSARTYVEKGNAFFDRGEYREASLNYRKALQKDPKSGEAYHRLGLSEWKQGNAADAFQALSFAVQLSPDSEPSRVDLCNFALEIYLQDPQRPKLLYDRLVALGEELLRKNPNSPDGFRVKGYLALLDHKPQPALEFFRRANQARPGQEEIIVGFMEALYQSQQVAEAEKLGLDSIAEDKNGRIYDALVRLYSSTGRTADAEQLLIRKTKDHPREARYALELAAYYAQARKSAEMTAALQPLITDAAAFPEGRLRVGEFYAGRADWPHAIEQFQAGASANPKDIRYRERIAQVLVFQNKRPEALKILDDAVQSKSADPRSRELRAALLLENPEPGKPDQGIAEFQSLVNQAPNDILLRFLFAKAQLQRGNIGAARAQLTEVTSRDPSFLEARLLSAEIALQEGQFNEALRHSSDALTLDPNNFRAQFARASALLALGSLDQAESAFNGLLRQAPGSVDVRLQLALLESRKKNFSGAETAYKKILDSSPGELRALAGLVQIYSGLRQMDRAIGLLSGELQRSKGRAEIRNMLADTAARAGKYDLAIEQYQLLAAANPDSIDAKIQLADVLQRKGDVPGAISILESAAAKQPGDVRPPAMLAALFDRSNRRDEAKVQCRKALALRPNDVALMNNLADMLAETGDSLDEALQLARQAVQKEPANPIFSDTLGWVYLKKGMNDNAVQTLRQLVQQHSDNAVFSYHLGVALFQKGDSAEARLQLGRALELQPSSELKKQINQTLNQVN